MDEQLDVRPPPGRTDFKPMAPRRRRLVTPILSLLVLALAGLLGWWLLQGGSQPHRVGPAGAANAPQPVGVATIGTGNMDVVLTGLGAVTPLATVTVQTQINGQLQQFGFTEGQIVHKGDFLAQIDPRPYQVALEQAQGTLAHDTGLLNQAKADYARYQTLNRQDSISRQQVEDQFFLIKQYEGSVATDQAAIDNAKLNLVYCHITSPVDGRVGIRLVDPGNYVQTSNTSGLVVITQLQPMSVLFTLPENDVAEVQSQMAAGTLQVQAYDATNTKLIATGTLATMDNEIDSATGTVKLRAMFPNTDYALFPQQFVNARLLVRTLTGVVQAPQAAVQNGAPGDFVYLVKPGNTVGVQVVKTGVTANGMVQILQGLKPGDRVVTDGLDRLKDGARITIVAEPTPGATGQAGNGQAAPAPAPAPDNEATPTRRRGNRRNGAAGGAPAGAEIPPASAPAGGPASAPNGASPSAPTGG